MAPTTPQTAERPEPGNGNLPSTPSPRRKRRRRPATRSLPPWIASYGFGDGPVPKAQLDLLRPPARIIRVQQDGEAGPPGARHSVDGYVSFDDPDLGSPRQTRSRLRHFLRHGRAPRHGRDWDHLRSAEPVIVPAYASAPRQADSDWNGFVRSSAWARTDRDQSLIIPYDYLNHMQPTNFDQKKSAKTESRSAAETPAKPRRKLSAKIWKRMMRSPLVPPLFRLIVMITSVLALGISGKLFQLEDAVKKDSAGRSQAIVGVAVDTVAIPFIAFTIYDELTGRPLGLRSAVRKISLILLDLFFIIFKSASTALAFESVVYHTMSGSHARALTKALAGVMLLGLVLWSINFALNIFRVIVKLGGDHDPEEGLPYQVGNRVKP